MFNLFALFTVATFAVTVSAESYVPYKNCPRNQPTTSGHITPTSVFKNATGWFADYHIKDDNPNGYTDTTCLWELKWTGNPQYVLYSINSNVLSLPYGQTNGYDLHFTIPLTGVTPGQYCLPESSIQYDFSSQNGCPQRNSEDWKDDCSSDYRYCVDIPDTTTSSSVTSKTTSSTTSITTSSVTNKTTSSITSQITSSISSQTTSSATSQTTSNGPSSTPETCSSYTTCSKYNFYSGFEHLVPENTF